MLDQRATDRAPADFQPLSDVRIECAEFRIHQKLFAPQLEHVAVGAFLRAEQIPASLLFALESLSASLAGVDHDAGAHWSRTPYSS